MHYTRVVQIQQSLYSHPNLRSLSLPASMSSLFSMPPLHPNLRPSPSTLCVRRSFPLLSLSHTNSPTFHFFLGSSCSCTHHPETAKPLLERARVWESCCCQTGHTVAAGNMGQLLLLVDSLPQAEAASLDAWEAGQGKDFRTWTTLAAQTVLHLLWERTADSKAGWVLWAQLHP